MQLLSAISLVVPAVLAQYGGSGGGSTPASSAAAAASTTASSSSSVQTVAVGQSGLSFSPNSLTVVPGNKVVFQFYPGGHSVTQGDASNPCQPSNATGFFSGTINSSSGPASDAFTITVNSTDPIYIYCSQVGHCQAGMVAVINPSSPQALDQYMSGAKGTSKSSAPAAAQGGVVGAPAAASSSSGGASTTAAPKGGAASTIGAFGFASVAVIVVAMMMV